MSNSAIVAASVVLVLASEVPSHADVCITELVENCPSVPTREEDGKTDYASTSVADGCVLSTSTNELTLYDYRTCQPTAVEFGHVKIAPVWVTGKSVAFLQETDNGEFWATVWDFDRKETIAETQLPEETGRFKKAGNSLFVEVASGTKPLTTLYVFTGRNGFVDFPVAGNVSGEAANEDWIVFRAAFDLKAAAFHLFGLSRASKYAFPITSFESQGQRPVIRLDGNLVSVQRNKVVEQYDLKDISEDYSGKNPDGIVRLPTPAPPEARGKSGSNSDGQTPHTDKPTSNASSSKDNDVSTPTTKESDERSGLAKPWLIVIGLVVAALVVLVVVRKRKK